MTQETNESVMKQSANKDKKLHKDKKWANKGRMIQRQNVAEFEAE